MVRLCCHASETSSIHSCTCLCLQGPPSAEAPDEGNLLGPTVHAVISHEAITPTMQACEACSLPHLRTWPGTETLCCPMQVYTTLTLAVGLATLGIVADLVYHVGGALTTIAAVISLVWLGFTSPVTDSPVS